MATWDFSKTKHHLLICNGSSCMRKQGEEVTLAIREEISRQGLDDVIHTSRTRCNGRCKDACVVVHYPEGTWYKSIAPEVAEDLIQSIAQGKKLEEKVSHFYEDGFIRVNDTDEGLLKSEKNKQKV